ncbi:hypothetical protein PUV47_15575 [Pseudovibrio exalbescens]|uniref:tetratricopeptide repeat protein n=1 Tax=Pseudovibrio exalbescens TaxID=197461 RepID=UPI002365F8F6|nr:hypothetical protein [Pseudovibrio exalbescens]MDD7911350.1 hypothetical protein [Pseudovibrio exalbescens]
MDQTNGFAELNELPHGQSADAKPAEPAEILEKEIRDALERILGSDEFNSVSQLRQFLRFIVEAKLGGEGHLIKGYTIATTALGRPSSFNPANDPIVRVEASRLRKRLEEYYNGSGRNDPIHIAMPVGTYSPLFTRRDDPAPSQTHEVQQAVHSPVSNLPGGGGHDTVAYLLGKQQKLYKQRLALSIGLSMLVLMLLVVAAVLSKPGQALFSYLYGESHETIVFTPGAISMPSLFVDQIASGSTRTEMVQSAQEIKGLLKSTVQRMPMAKEAFSAEEEGAQIISGAIYYAHNGTTAFSFRVDEPESSIPFIRRRFNSKGSIAISPWQTRAQLVRSAVQAMMSPDMLRPQVNRNSSAYSLTPYRGRSCVVDAEYVVANRFAYPHEIRDIEDCLTKLTRDHPDFDPALLASANILLLRAILEGSSSGEEIKRAEILIDRIQPASKLTSQYQSTQMLHALAQGELEEARVRGQNAMQLNQFDPTVLSDYGQQLLILNDWEEAITVLNSITTPNITYPDRFDALLALAYYSRGRSDEAYTTGLRLRPESYPLAWLVKILVADAKGEDDEVEQLANALRATEPEIFAHPQCILRQQLGQTAFTQQLYVSLNELGVGIERNGGSDVYANCAAASP